MMRCEQRERDDENVSNSENGMRQNASADGAQPRLTKDEMREKIKASLASGNRKIGSVQQEEPPVQLLRQTPPKKEQQQQRNSARIPGETTKQSRAEKAKQIRENMSAQRGNEEAPKMTTTPSYQPINTKRNDSHSSSQKQREQQQMPPKREEQTPIRELHSPTRPASAPKRSVGSVMAGEPKNAMRALLIGGIVLVAAILIFYIGGLVMYHGKFLPNTYVNDINISGMSGDEATKAILNTAQEMGLTFVPKSGDNIVFKGSSFGCQVSVPAGSLDEAASEGRGFWFKKLFSKTEYQVTLNESYSEADLASLIAAYDWGNVPPKDAEIVKNDDGTFSIQPEDDGNMVDTTILSDYTVSEMRLGNNVIQMEESSCYKKAKVKSEDLADELAMYQKIGRIEITYDMTDRQENLDPVGTETISSETFMDWINTSSGELVLDKEKAAAWVKENIADKYDTLVTGYTREFQSTLNGTIQLPIGPDGIYGWKTDVDATVAKMQEHILEGEPMTIEPVYKVEGYRKGDDSGNTYIEVDLGHQKMFYYVNGNLYLESDVVTGTATDPSRATPPGAYKVWSRESPRKLGTYAVQGYETWVQYWMPVTYTGIGLHDLNRSAYGGSIYQTNGSHGCINLPLNIAADLYNQVEVGTPVMIIP